MRTIKELAAALTNTVRVVTDAVATIGTHSDKIAQLEARVRELECAANRDTERVVQRARAQRSVDTERYPNVDAFGCRYRIEKVGGRMVKCYVPGN